MTTRNILVNVLKQTPLEQQKLEIVERKGIGHPDCICDSIMDRISVNLSQEYIKKAGMILHHNIDKSLLAAGEAETKFGGGKIKKPMLLVIGDQSHVRCGRRQNSCGGIGGQNGQAVVQGQASFCRP